MPLPEHLSQLNRMIDEQPRQPGNTPRISSSEINRAPMLRRGFPLRHLTNPATEHRDGWTQALEKLLNIGDGIILICGGRGTGKTQLAIDAAASHIAWGTVESRQPCYTKASDIFRDIRATFRKDSPLTEREVVEDYVKAKLLIIDEAHERGETDFEDKTLTHIIDKRYDAMVGTVLISNLTRAEMGKALGPSIVSRVHECGQVIEFTWPSFRQP